MARIYDSVNGEKLERYLASMPATQWEVENRALEIGMRAENLLKDHHVEDIAHIDVDSDGIDSEVLLVDSNVTNSETKFSNTALSIEFGRQAFIDPDTGERWGAMDGLYILTRAAHLKHRPHATVKNKPTMLSKAAFFAALSKRQRRRYE